MVIAPNARGKFVNTQMANLAGGVTPDTHFPVLAGNPRMDTRRAVLAGEVTDSHNAILNGGIEGVDYRVTAAETDFSISGTAVSFVSVYHATYTVPLAPSFVTIFTQTRAPPPEPQSGVLAIFIAHLHFSEIPEGFSFVWRIRRNGTILRTETYNPIRTAIIYPFMAYAMDSDPQPANNTYTFELFSTVEETQVNVLNGTMGTVIVDFLNDTHSASLEGDEGIDTHSVIMRGQSIATMQAELLGEPGTDTHIATLLGNPPSAISYRELQTTPIIQENSSNLRYIFFRNSTLPDNIESTIEVSNNAERVLVLATFFMGYRFFADQYSITVRRLNGPILGTFDVPQTLGPTMEPVSFILIDNAPIQGTNTYRLDVVNNGRPNSRDFSCYSLTLLDMPDINDTHFAELVGENEDTHNAIIEGSIIEDTHHGDLGGMGPVDTHNAEVVGSARGKSPIGGRL